MAGLRPAKRLTGEKPRMPEPLKVSGAVDAGPTQAAKSGKRRFIMKKDFELVGYPVRYDERLGWWVDAPCGCYAHPEESCVGHPYCAMPPRPLLDAEEEGLVSRLYTEPSWSTYSGWYWLLTRAGEEALGIAESPPPEEVVPRPDIYEVRRGEVKLAGWYRRRQRQVRDALNKLRDPELLEEIARLLKV